MKRRAAGFTLIEVMISLAIVGILTAVALPAYKAYVVKARLTDAVTGLSGIQSEATTYWENKRTFKDFDKVPSNTSSFKYTLVSHDVNSMLVQAEGQGKVVGFTYTVDQNGKRATTAAPAGYGTSTSCWVIDKGGKCAD